MMKRVAVLLLIWSPLAVADFRPYLTLHSFTYVEPVSMTYVFQNDNNRFEGGETALTHNWAETGITYNNFGVGLVGRYDYDMKFSEDTAEFYHLTNNKKPLPEGRIFDLYLNAKHIYSNGVRFSYGYELTPNTDINIGLSYLKGTRLTDGTIQGSGVVLSENDYDFQFDVDYFYSEDTLFERRVDSPQGRGYSLDLSLNWDINRNFGLELKVIDLVGRIYWDNAPFTTAVANSDVKEYDEDGYVIYNPVLSGYEGNTDYTQKLDPQIDAMVRYNWTHRFAMLGRILSFKTADFYQAGLRYAFSNTSHVSALYMMDIDALSLGYKMEYFGIMLTSDSLDFDKAHILSLSLNVSAKF